MVAFVGLGVDLRCFMTKEKIDYSLLNQMVEFILSEEEVEGRLRKVIRDIKEIL